MQYYRCYCLAILIEVFQALNLARKVQLRTVVTTSFNMVNGRVRYFSGHLRRLTDNAPYASTYEQDIRRRLRSAGSDVFATVQVENHTFNVEIRPPRPFQTTLTVDVHGHRDERLRPGIRGRDQAWQSRTLATSRRRGADAGLLIDERGNAISPIEGSLLVLKGEMVFHSTHERALASVLEEPVLDYLVKQGSTPKARPEGFNIEELRGAEVWFLSSYTGIQLVTAWLEYSSTFKVPEKRPVAPFVPTFSEVNQYLWDTAEEV